MSKIIDADKLYKHIKAECNPYGNPTISYEDGCKMLDIINNTEELPTMQSNNICVYCKNFGQTICFSCDTGDEFAGKKVIEVE